MKYSLTTRYLKLTPADMSLLDKKLERLEKYLKPPFHADVMLRHDTHHRRGNTVTCSVNIKQAKSSFHARRTAETIQNALDEVIEVLKSELARHSGKKRGHNK